MRFLVVPVTGILLSMPQTVRCVEDFDDDLFPDLDESSVTVEPGKPAVEKVEPKIEQKTEAALPATPAAATPAETAKPVESKPAATAQEEVAKPQDVVKEITAKQQLVDALKNTTKKHVAVKVYAPWCGACKMAESTFKEAAEEHKEAIDAYAVNADAAETREFVDAFGVTGLPTVIYIRINDKNHESFGKWLKDFAKKPEATVIEYKAISGAKPADAFKQDIKNWLENTQTVVTVIEDEEPEIAPEEKPAKKHARKTARKHTRRHHRTPIVEEDEEN